MFCRGGVGGRGRKGIKKIEAHTESSGGAEQSTTNGVIVGVNIGAVNAASLNRMIQLGVEHRVYVVPTHCERGQVVMGSVINFF